MSMIFGTAIRNGNLFYIDDLFGIMVEVDITRKKIVSKVDLKFKTFKTFSNGIEYENFLVFAPWSGDDCGILYVDTINKTADEIPIRKNSLNYDHAFFHSITKIGERIFLIPFQYDALVEISPHSKKIKYYKKDILASLYDQSGTKDILLSRFAAVWRDKVLFMPYTSLNRIVWHEISSNETGFFDVPVSSRGFAGICIDGDLLYLLARNSGDLYILRADGKKIIDSIHLADGTGELFLNLVDCGSCLVAIQRFYEKSYKIDKADLSIEEIDLHSNGTAESINILCAKYNKDTKEIWMTPRDRDQGLICIYDMSRDLVRWDYYPAIKSQHLYRSIQDHRAIMENDTDDLKLFLEELCR